MLEQNNKKKYIKPAAIRLSYSTQAINQTCGTGGSLNVSGHCKDGGHPLKRCKDGLSFGQPPPLAPLP